MISVGVAGHVLKTIESRRICSRFRASILPTSVVFDGKALRVQISNKTDSRIVVRQVYLERHAGERHALMHDRLVLVEERSEKLNDPRPDTIISQAEMDRGFVELPPHTHGVWVSDHVDIIQRTGQMPRDFAHLHVSYQYQNMFGGYEVKDVSVKEIGDAANNLVDSHQSQAAGRVRMNAT